MRVDDVVGVNCQALPPLRRELPTRPGRMGMVGSLSPDFRLSSTGQGLTLVHFSAQLEPCLTQTPTLNTP